MMQACIQPREVVYFQGGEFGQEAKFVANDHAAYKLQTGDVLSVRIKSQDETLTKHMNIEPENNLNGFSEPGFYINGYSIDAEGYIELPDLGKIKASGCTVGEVQQKVQAEIEKTLTEGTALVKLVSFKFSVLGEVRAPGYYFNYNTQLTVLEALAKAGDIKEMGNRKEVMLIRRMKDGNEVMMIDLTDANLLSSPYFYLRPNDQLYVKPLKIQQKRSNLANLQIFSVIFTGISTAITVILLLQNNSNGSG